MLILFFHQQEHMEELSPVQEINIKHSLGIAWNIKII